MVLFSLPFRASFRCYLRKRMIFWGKLRELWAIPWDAFIGFLGLHSSMFTHSFRSSSSLSKCFGRICFFRFGLRSRKSSWQTNSKLCLSPSSAISSLKLTLQWVLSAEDPFCPIVQSRGQLALKSLPGWVAQRLRAQLSKRPAFKSARRHKSLTSNALCLWESLVIAISCLGNIFKHFSPKHYKI